MKIHIIVGIVFAIFFIFKRNEINNCLVICIKAFLEQTNIARFYTTTKPCTSLYYNTNTDVDSYNRILFSGVKLSKEVCVHHIEHEPVLLTVGEIYFCIITHQIHQLLHMQGFSFYFHVSIMGMYQIEW